MATTTQLLTALSSHIGRDKGICARQLSGRLDTPERRVRELVTEARLEGAAICGHPRDGYFMAETAEELEETCKFLRARALQSLLVESKLRKLTLADLLGQMKLPT
jgi:hypothetical protein